MIRIVTKDNEERNVRNLYQMHRLRKAVFKDRLGWDVTVSGELEFDQYDALGPSYLLSIDRYGTLNGCVRLLPTTGPKMLRDIFPYFVTKVAVPRGERVWEASRFAVSGNAATVETGLSQTTYDLLIGVLKFGLSNGIQHDRLCCRRANGANPEARWLATSSPRSRAPNRQHHRLGRTACRVRTNPPTARSTCRNRARSRSLIASPRLNSFP